MLSDAACLLPERKGALASPLLKLLPRGVSPKPAMSTVQAAGRTTGRGQGGRAGWAWPEEEERDGV